MPQAVPLAIAGFGLVGRRHAAAIAQCAGAELAAVIEPEAEARAEARALGCAVYPDLDAFFAAGGADGLILATPNPLHVAQGLQAVAAGLPVLVEKPIATQAADAVQLIAAAEQAGVPLLVGHHRRYNPIIQAAQEAIARGDLGELRAVQATCWFYKPDAYFNAADWRKRPGAGPVAVNLVHDIDLMRHLCGEVVSVRALAAPSRRGFDNEDLASALLSFASGVIGTVSVSDSITAPWSWEMTAREHPIYPPTSESCYMIGGSRGALSLPDLRLWQHGAGEPDWWAPISATSLMRAATDPLVNQIAHFIDVIAHGAAPLVSGREGLRTLEVIEAMQLSAAEGRDIALQPAAPREVAQAG
ncbi:Gfo/Idh/MocA family protein [Dinoroseobacter sp. S76]|uniref:Gfo/Idh/MocA family protein n=1 Tax=Dinoroseobacter sp. S76 TaxID=3415124 RepID=UPI003C79899A